jgi:hypothetical protein
MSPTTSRSTTAKDGRYKPILSPISQRPKPSRKFRQQTSGRYRSLLSSDLSLSLDSDEENESGGQLSLLRNKLDTPPSAQSTRITT